MLISPLQFFVTRTQLSENVLTSKEHEQNIVLRVPNHTNIDRPYINIYFTILHETNVYLTLNCILLLLNST